MTEPWHALALDHLPLVPMIARSVRRRMSAWPPSLLLEDLEAEGCVGLCQAAQRFDGRAIQFKTFAEPRVRGAMLDLLRRESLVGRTAATRGKRAVFVPLEDRAAEATACQPEPWLWALVDTLPRRSRHVLVWRYRDEVTQREVGRRLGVGESWANQLEWRAVKRLREEMTR